MKKQIYQFNYLLKSLLLSLTFMLGFYPQLDAQDFNVNPFVFYGTNGGPYQVRYAESSPTGITFSNDGFRIFIVGTSGGDVNQFDLSTAFDVTTASLNGLFDISTEEAAIQDITFSDNGLRMFVVGVDGDEVNQYDLTTPFDVTTASFTGSANNPFDISAQETVPTGIAFSNDGLLMSISGLENIIQYTLTQAFDITTAAFNASDNNPLDISGQESSCRGLSFSNDGLKMFVFGTRGDDVNQYDLTVPFDITTATFDDSFSLTSGETSPQGLVFSGDGLRMFVVGDLLDEVNQYDLTYAFDITTASLTISENVFDVSEQDINPSGVTFSNDGLRMFVLGSFSKKVLQYDLNTAFDVTTATYLDAFSIPSVESAPHEVVFSSDGSRMFIIGNDEDEINQYDLTTPFDVTTATFTASANNPFDVSVQTLDPRSFTFSNDGLRMFIAGDAGKEVNQYDLTTAFDITTASFTESATNPFDISGQETFVRGIDFSLDGLRMFIVGASSDAATQYDLTTPFDIETASFTATANNPFSVSSQTTFPIGITFSNNRERMFIVDVGGQIIQYDVTDSEAPVIEINQSFTYEENQTNGFEIGTVAATDNLSVRSFSIISGNDDGFFSITKSGKLILITETGAANDFETGANSFNLSIVAIDPEGNESTITAITIDITDSEEFPPEIAADQIFTYNENQESGFEIGTVSATDNVGVTGFSIATGNNDGFFAIDLSGILTLTTLGATGVANDFEIEANSFDLGVVARDAVGNESEETIITIEVLNVDETAPEVTLSQSFTYAENQVSGFQIGAVSASDNVGITNFSITSGNEDGVFAIDDAGILTLTDAGAAGVVNDFETGDNSFRIIVVVSDAAGNESPGTFVTIEVTDVDDELPVVTPSQVFNFAENQKSGFEIGTVTATDNVEVGRFSITAGNEDGFFEISDAGIVTLTAAGVAGAANDFETGDNSFILNLVVADAAGNESTATFITIDLTDVDDESPVVTSSQIFNFVENQESSFEIGAVTASDNVGVESFSITVGNDAGFFAIDIEGNLTLTAAGMTGAANDFEVGDNSFTISIVASDAAGNESTESTIIIEVSDVDDTAPVVGADQNFSYAENQVSGFEIGTVTASDNVGVTSFLITTGNEEEFFAIDTEGIVTLTAAGLAGAANDFETGDNSFTISIVASDAAGNESTESTITIEVSDVDDTAPELDAGQSFTYAENQTNSFTIGTVTASDNVGVVSFSITTGNDDGFFAMNDAGILTLTAVGVAGSANDFEAGDNSFTLSIIASDEVGNESEEDTITIEVSDVEDTPPVVDVGQSFTYAENQVSGFEIGTVKASDNVGVTSFLITTGNEEGFFAIDTEGHLTLTATGESGSANDFEVGENSYTLSVKASDAAGNESIESTIIIEVSDVDDTAPMVDADQIFTYEENQESEFIIGTVTASDNVGVTSFLITTGNEEEFFAIDTEGNLTLTAAGAAGFANDFETGENSYTLSMTASDAAGNESIASSITIEVRDVDDQVLSIGESVDAEITLYPNPAANSIHIKSEQQVLKVHLYSLNGSLITEGTTNQLDVSGIANGTYLIKVTTGKGEYVENIIVNHND